MKNFRSKKKSFDLNDKTRKKDNNFTWVNISKNIRKIIEQEDDDDKKFEEKQLEKIKKIVDDM